MVYTAFLDTIRQMVQAKLADSGSAQIRQISKNNGLVLDGLCVSPPGGGVSPTIYLNPYYPLYQKGMSLEEIIQDIFNILADNSRIPDISTKSLSDFTVLRSKVAYKLIHTASNQELLKDIPHIPFLDLSIVFYLYLESTKNGQMTALIHKDHQKMWQISTEELYDIAKTNTPILLPAQIKNMYDVMEEIAADQLGEDYKKDFLDMEQDDHRLSPLSVLSNSSGFHGAAAILYEGVLKNFAKPLGQDLVILPSSIHEVLLLPYDETTDFSGLCDMVASINQSEVPAEDQLSNQVYLYSLSDDRISLVTNSSVPIGTRNPL